MKSLVFLFVSGVILIFSPPVSSKEDSALDRVLADNPQAVEVLVGYPSDVRQAVLEASLHPDTLFEMGSRQKQTRAQFQSLISTYPRKTQEKIYNVVRYPDLLKQLAEGGEKSKDQLKALTRDYPKGVQEAALDLGRKELPFLANLQSLYLQTDQDFEKLLQPLPASGQKAYRTLIRHPEVLETLYENRDFTLALGRSYRLDPSGTTARLQDLSQKLASKNQDALEDYRQTLNQDPKALEDLKKSSKQFAKEYGYYEGDYVDPPPSSYSGNGSSVIISINPYPYWFGYPYWYPTPFWRPYPLWYTTGFYFGLGGGFLWGWPSYYYTNWFYSYPYNFYRYPYLASCYGNYYYRWRNYPVYNGFNPVVRNWHNVNRTRINSNLWRNDVSSANRWRDFGRQETVLRTRQATQPSAFQQTNRIGQGIQPRSMERARSINRQTAQPRNFSPIESSSTGRPQVERSFTPREGNRAGEVRGPSENLRAIPRSRTMEQANPRPQGGQITSVPSRSRNSSAVNSGGSSFSRSRSFFHQSPSSFNRGSSVSPGRSSFGHSRPSFGGFRGGSPGGFSRGRR